MQLKVKASQTFKQLKTAEKPAFGTIVLNGLDSSTFPNPPIELTELLGINTNLNSSFISAQSGNLVAKAELKAAVAVWNNAFTLSANYVSTVADGNEAIIRQSGFLPTKSESTPKQKPGPVTSFKAEVNGSRGAIVIGSKNAVAGADSYVTFAASGDAVISYNGNTLVITIGENSVYINASTSKQTEMYDLPSGTPFNVGMYAINSAGSGPAVTVQQVIPQ